MPPERARKPDKQLPCAAVDGRDHTVYDRDGEAIYEIDCTLGWNPAMLRQAVDDFKKNHTRQHLQFSSNGEADKAVDELDELGALVFRRGTLVIIFGVESNAHNQTCGELLYQVATWMHTTKLGARATHLHHFKCGRLAGSNHPDVLVKSRCPNTKQLVESFVLEFEYRHRKGVEMRRDYFHHFAGETYAHLCGLVGIMVHDYRDTYGRENIPREEWRAAAVVYAREGGDDITVVGAYDFGPKPLGRLANGFTKEIREEALPPVSRFQRLDFTQHGVEHRYESRVTCERRGEDFVLCIPPEYMVFGPALEHVRSIGNAGNARCEISLKQVLDSVIQCAKD